jgi:hypothetical protein
MKLVPFRPKAPLEKDIQSAIKDIQFAICDYLAGRQRGFKPGTLLLLCGDSIASPGRGRKAVPQQIDVEGRATTNVVVGFLIALATQVVAFPLFGLAVSATENAYIAMIFTVVSLVRSFTLRRVFEAIRTHQNR